MAEPISKSAYAKRIGVVKSRINQLENMGLPVRDDGKIDPLKADDWLENNRDPRRVEASRRSISAGKSLVELKKRNEEIKAEQGEIALLKTRGEVLDRAGVERWVEGYYRQERDMLMAWCSRVAPLMVGKNLSEVHSTLDAEMRAVLIELSELRSDTPES